MPADYLKYAKIRAALHWAFESLMVCMLACGAMMLVIQAVDQFVPGIVIPDRRKPLTYILIVIWVLLFRSFRLVSLLESIDSRRNSGAEVSADEGSASPSDSNAMQKAGPSRVAYNLSLPSEICDETGRLQVSMAEFVRYCVKGSMYEPYTNKAWKPIDGMLLNKEGKPISSKQLAQSYQDLLSKGTV